MSRRRPNDTYTDEELLAGIQNADHDVFTTLYSRHFQSLSLAALKYVKDTAIAEEIVQDIFLKLWETPGDILNVRSLKAYLYRAVINHSINYVNRQKNIELHHQRIAEETSHEQIENLMEDHALKEMLYQEIERLPAQCRKVFKMSRFQDLKYREIAEQLNLSEKTVENHIVNALKILRSKLLDKDTFKDDWEKLRMVLGIIGV
jgi:RNA polymerase sigma-70 factor (ECF subfamily)